MSITTAVPGGVKIFLLNYGQVKQLTYIFIHSPKKGNVTKCTNNCTIALNPYANKIILSTNKKKFQSYIGHETPMEHAGLIKGVVHGSE